MVLSRRVARFNRAVTNKVLGRLAGRVPSFCRVVHRGRRSGREYRTPVNAMRVPGGYVIALPYGSGADWVRNVLAAGECALETNRGTVQFDKPRIERDESCSPMPAIARPLLRLVGVSEFLYLDETNAHS